MHCSVDKLTGPGRRNDSYGSYTTGTLEEAVARAIEDNGGKVEIQQDGSIVCQKENRAGSYRVNANRGICEIFKVRSE